MIVRRHVVDIAEQVVGASVVAYVNKDIEIASAHRLVDHALGVTG